MRELQVDREFFNYLVSTGKLNPVTFMIGDRRHVGYPAERIAEIAQRAASAVPRARW